MHKRLVAVAGLGLTVAASVALSSPAGAAPAPRAPKLVTFHAIAAAHSASVDGLCGYPVQNPILTLVATVPTASAHQSYKFGGSYGCNGHGLGGFGVTLTSTTKAVFGVCSSTATTGAYACSLPAKSSGIAKTTIRGLNVSTPVALTFVK